MFKTGQALLLRQRRVLRPRSGRDLDAGCPRHCPASRPWPCPVRDRVQSETSPHPRHDRVRVQSVTVFWSCPHPRPQPVHVRDRVRAANVRTQPMSVNHPCPRPVRSRAQSVTVSSSRLWTDRDRVESGKCPVTVASRPHSGRFISRDYPRMSAFDPNDVRKAVSEFTPRHQQKFENLLPAREVIVTLRR